MWISRKRVTASAALEHPFINLANHRGLGDRISLEKLRGYCFRRKWEVGQKYKHNVPLTYLLQCGCNLVKTIVQPKPLSAILADIPAVVTAPNIDIGAPQLNLPKMDGEQPNEGSETSSMTGMELGPTGMLQVNPSPCIATFNNC